MLLDLLISNFFLKFRYKQDEYGYSWLPHLYLSVLKIFNIINIKKKKNIFSLYPSYRL